MTIEKLIERLKEFPPDRTVWMDYDGHGYGSIDEVEETKTGDGKEGAVILRG